MVATRNVVVRGTTDKPVASQILARYFETSSGLDGGQLFVGYPITTAADGKRPIDAVYVSPHVGVVVFDIVEGTDLGNFQSRQDDIATRLEVKLKSHRDLVERRVLQVSIHTVTFAPALTRRDALPEVPEPYVVVNNDSLDEALSGLSWPYATADRYKSTLAAMQSISGIRRSGAVREVQNEASRGAKLKSIEGSIATLDAQQSHAVIETVEGVQRIRGLAGSGKTIVLALKAAYLHAQHPDWKIAVTFNARSLRAQFERLINTFCIEQTGEEPDWSNIHVLHAWGAGGGGNREGVYHRFCVENDIRYFDFNTAKAQFGATNAFRGSCRQALTDVSEPEPIYDSILVDEAQDLPPEFLQICYWMLGETKRLVYAYDELQTLNGTGLPSVEELFGLNADGTPRVRFDQQERDKAQRDIILEKCYRNPGPVLTTAHALGFGIYRTAARNEKTGLVQMFGQKELWNDIGYRVVGGELKDGCRVALKRDEKSSPGFLHAHSPIDDLIQFRSFEDAGAQAQWVADSIQRNLEADELRAEDIVVINPDPFTTRANTGIIRRALLDRGIATHLAGVDVGADVFFKVGANSVTFTGVYRAKGNEAGMVYVINAHESFSSTANLARIRNRLFTAITRSKAWVRVSGLGSEMEALMAEFSSIKQAKFVLDFVYPTEEQRASLQIVHREKSRVEEKRIRRRNEYLDTLVDELESGSLYPEDIDPEVLERFRRVIDTDHE